MEDVLGANSVHSQVVYNEFILMFLALFSMIVSLINYEVNFENLVTLTADSVCSGCIKEMINLVSAVFNSFATLVMMMNIYFRYKLQIKFESFTQNLTKEDNLFTSGYIKNVIVECLIAIIHPNAYFLGKNFIYVHSYPDWFSEELKFSVNEILLAFMMVRIYFIIKFFVTLSYYQSSRAARTCRMYGESNSYLFAVRCIFNRNPFRFVLILFLFSLFSFSITIRIFERLFLTSRNSNLDHIFLTFDYGYFINSVWCSIITMLTVGYGDYYPRTIMGRVYTIFEVLSGLVAVSLVTVGYFKNSELNSAQNKVYILLKRMNLRGRHEALQKKIIEMLMHTRYAVFKIKKINLYMLKNAETITPEETKRLNKEIATLEKKKKTCEIHMKHLVRDKNITNKNLQNISTSQYILETIIDDIQSLIEEVEDSNKRVEEIIKDFSLNFKRDNLVITAIKKKVNHENKLKHQRSRQDFSKTHTTNFDHMRREYSNITYSEMEKRAGDQGKSDESSLVIEKN
jgi:hypothetical protein